MYYDKIVRYLEYLEGGEKIKSAGFVKIEVMDRDCNIQVNVTGLYPMESCNREIHISGISEGKYVEGVLGEVILTSGRGNLIKRRVPTDRLCEGIGYQDLTTVRINLGKNRELLCRWREETVDQQEVTPYQSEPVTAVEPEPQRSPLAVVEPEPQPESQRSPVADPEPELLQAETEWQENLECCGDLPGETFELPDQPMQEPEEKSAPAHPAAAPTMPTYLHDKKWRQLSEIYPHIAPFRDERDYLSIGPEDFVVLPEKYYRLINNSFLLHGYYNYGHMVLARSSKRGEEVYYIGVPGNFYEKERQVAVMFGFESFECRQEPARDGDFGYFMKRVEL